MPLSHLIIVFVCSGPETYVRNNLRLGIMASLLRVVKISFQIILSKCSQLILCMLIFLSILVYFYVFYLCSRMCPFYFQVF